MTELAYSSDLQLARARFDRPSFSLQLDSRAIAVVTMLRSRVGRFGNEALVAALWSLACSSSLTDPNGRESGTSAPPFSGVAGANGGNPLDGPGAGTIDSASSADFGVSDQPTNEVQVVCAAQSAASELRHVALAFLFDVSGSMGGDDRNRFETKWLPVVAASDAFFSETDAASSVQRVSASAR